MTSSPLAVMLSRQLRVLGGIHHVDAGAEHRDRPAAAIERAAMRGRIDAPREAADHDDAGAREIERNFVGGGEAFLRRGARTDHRDAD